MLDEITKIQYNRDSDIDVWEENYNDKPYVYWNRNDVIKEPALSRDNTLFTFGQLRELLYPIGSIYTSMNNTNPSTFIGGTWEQIVDRFLYCANSSMETGGSKKITVAQLPAHSHSITELDIRGNEDGSNQYTIAKYGGNDTIIKTGNTGNGEDYMPPYMTVFAWYRTG